MKHLTLSIALASLLSAAPSLSQEELQPEDTIAVASRASVIAQKHMVSAANPHAAEVGLNVLRAGGSAADAAVAVQIMLNLVEPQSSGIGGGAFLVYWDASEGKLVTLDGRETAPLAATEHYWLGKDGEPVKWFDAVVGGRSVGVPGTLKLLENMHQRWGKMDWAGLFEPTISMAEAGFEISDRLSASIASGQKRKLGVFPTTKDYFFNGVGRPRKAGTLLKNPDFAQTLRLIATQGSAPFYQGSIGKNIVAAIKTPINAGILDQNDLANYEVYERAPVCLDYRGYEVCGMGPPTSGMLTVGQILGQLESFDIASMGNNAEAWHLFAEAAKRAYADRGLYMADRDFVEMPEGLLNREYLRSRADEIDPAKAARIL